MKNVLYFFILLLSVSACRKEEPLPQTPEIQPPKVIDWEWQIPLKHENYGYMRTSCIVGDWIILSFVHGFDGDATLPNLKAYDKHTGNLVWQYQHPDLPNQDFRYMYAFEDKLILRYSRRWVCISANTRQIIWEKKHNEHYAFYNAATLDEDYIYTQENFCFHPGDFPFNDSSSMVRFHIPTGKKEKLYSEGLKPGLYGHPAMYLPAIYKEQGREIAVFCRTIMDESDRANDVLAVDIQTREVLWRHRNFSERNGPVLTAPVLYNGKVIVTHGTSVFCYEILSGTLIWKQTLKGENGHVAFKNGGPFLHEGKLYLFDYQGFGFCLDPTTGNRLWETNKKDNYDLPSYNPNHRPVVKDGVILVTSPTQRNLVAYDANSGEVLEISKEAIFNDTNVLYDQETNKLYVAGDDKLLAFTVNK